MRQGQRGVPPSGDAARSPASWYSQPSSAAYAAPVSSRPRRTGASAAAVSTGDQLGWVLTVRDQGQRAEVHVSGVVTGELHRK